MSDHQLIEDYCRSCLVRGYSPRTVEAKRAHLRRFLAWCRRVRYSLATLEPDSLINYPTELAAGNPGRRPLDVATRRNHLTSVRLFLRHAWRLGRANADLSLTIDLPRVPRRLTQDWLSVDEFSQLCRRLPESPEALRDRALIEILFATGLRRAEAAALTLSDMDYARHLVTVHHGKGGHARRVPIARQALRWIARYLEMARPALAGTAHPTALLLDDSGQPFGLRRMSDHVGRLLRRAGINKRGACKLFRHGTATAMLENGADLRHVQEMLGHADISTTQVYAHVTITELRRIYEHTHPAARQRRRPST